MGELWANSGHFEVADDCRSRVDGRRLLLECPSSQEWYFGERVRDWRTVPLVARPIPEHVPLETFWPHLMDPLEFNQYARGMGKSHETRRGDYLRFTREDLLPPCPFIYGDDPPEPFGDLDHDSGLDFRAARSEGRPYRGRAPSDYRDHDDRVRSCSFSFLCSRFLHFKDTQMQCMIC